MLFHPSCFASSIATCRRTIESDVGTPLLSSSLIDKFFRSKQPSCDQGPLQCEASFQKPRFDELLVECTVNLRTV